VRHGGRTDSFEKRGRFAIALRACLLAGAGRNTVTNSSLETTARRPRRQVSLCLSLGAGNLRSFRENEAQGASCPCLFSAIVHSDSRREPRKRRCFVHSTNRGWRRSAGQGTSIHRITDSASLNERSFVRRMNDSHCANNTSASHCSVSVFHAPNALEFNLKKVIQASARENRSGSANGCDQGLTNFHVKTRSPSKHRRSFSEPNATNRLPDACNRLNSGLSLVSR